MLTASAVSVDKHYSAISGKSQQADQAVGPVERDESGKPCYCQPRKDCNFEEGHKTSINCILKAPEGGGGSPGRVPKSGGVPDLWI